MWWILTIIAIQHTLVFMNKKLLLTYTLLLAASVVLTAQDITYRATTYQTTLSNSSNFTYEVKLVRGKRVLHRRLLKPGEFTVADITTRPSQRKRTKVEVTYTRAAANSDLFINKNTRRDAYGSANRAYRSELDAAAEKLAARALATAASNSDSWVIRAAGEFTNGALNMQEAAENVASISNWNTIADALSDISEYAVDEALAKQVGREIRESTGLSLETSIEGTGYVITYLREVDAAVKRQARNHRGIEVAFTRGNEAIEARVTTTPDEKLSYTTDKKARWISYENDPVSPVFTFEYAPFSYGNALNPVFDASGEQVQEDKSDVDESVSDYQESMFTDRNEALRLGLPVSPEFSIGKGVHARLMAVGTWQRYSYEMNDEANESIRITSSLFNFKNATSQGFEYSSPLKVSHRRLGAEARLQLTFSKVISMSAFYGRALKATTTVDFERSPLTVDDLTWKTPIYTLNDTELTSQYGFTSTIAFGRRIIGLTAGVTWFDVKNQGLNSGDRLLYNQDQPVPVSGVDGKSNCRVDVGLAFRF